jgi:hypothetical protein
LRVIRPFPAQFSNCRLRTALQVYRKIRRYWKNFPSIHLLSGKVVKFFFLKVRTISLKEVQREKNV